MMDVCHSNNLEDKPLIWKRVVYTLCFFILCIIDQRKGSAVGTVQMIFANCTGFLIAAITLSAYQRKDFLRWPYMLWAVICVVCVPIAIVWGKDHYQYWGRWNIGVLNVAIYGFIVIRILYRIFVEKILPSIRVTAFLLFSFAMILMAVSKNDKIWPLWFFVMFGSLYVTGYSKREKETLCTSLMDGIIIGFFVIQGLALVFRPYDYVRYRGMYLGETQNGFFYLMVYCAFLCKWVCYKNKLEYKVRRWSCFVMCGVIIAFMLLNMGRTQIITAAIVTVAVLFVYGRRFEVKLRGLFVRAISILLVAAISFPMVYGVIRYIPPIFHHPIWYEGEYRENGSVRSFDSWDSERYIPFRKVCEDLFGRYYEMFGSMTGYFIKQTGNVLMPAIQVSASELGTVQIERDGSSREKALLTSEQAENSVLKRTKIFQWYMKGINFFGHPDTESGVWLAEFEYVTHSHNVFIQFLYIYGFFAGALFICMLALMGILPIVNGIKRKDEDIAVTMVQVAFNIAFIFGGMLECNWIYGTLNFTILFMNYYFIVRKEGKS